MPHRSDSADRVSSGFEYVAFLLAIPFWILLLRLEGLYDRDEERTDHSTVDDIVGVFRSVTIGVWIFALFGVATNLVQPVLARLGVFWLARDRPDPDAARVARLACRHLPGYTQNAVIVGAGNVGQQLALKLLEPPRVRHQPRRASSTIARPSWTTSSPSGSRSCSAGPTACASASPSTGSIA